MNRTPIYNKSRCVEKAAAYLLRRHGTPSAALIALRPALTRLQAASVASARLSPWALLERASRRYGFWIEVRITLLEWRWYGPRRELHR
jgi:hypothetical protein